VTLSSLQRRALINGGVATVVTLVIGMGVVAGLSDDGPEPPPRTPTPSVTSSPSPSCAPSWDIAQSANPGDLSTWLSGISVLSSSDAWAVGGSGDPAAPLSVLIERWDGFAWTAEEGPAPGSQVNELRGVDAQAANDVWAVGRTASGFGDDPLMLRFDGAQWAQVELPSEVSGVLNAVAAIAPDDVWAVGYTGDPAASLERALLMHWDGQLWAVVDAGRAVGLGRSALLDVEALASDDVWAVGYLHRQPLIVHYDGTEWSRSQTEVPGVAKAIEPITGADAWTAGAPIQRFEGETWTQAAVIPADGELFGIASVSGSDVWAVGLRRVSQDVTKSLVMRFDGRRWRVVPGHGVPGSDALTAIDALSDQTVLAVGYKDVPDGRRALAILGTTCSPPS
jgi:hypothetical protein